MEDDRESAFHRAAVVYGAILVLFVIVYFAGLLGGIVAVESKLIPARAIIWLWLALSVSVYVAALRTAGWAADRVLRKAGLKT